MLHKKTEVFPATKEGIVEGFYATDVCRDEERKETIRLMAQIGCAQVETAAEEIRNFSHLDYNHHTPISAPSSIIMTDRVYYHNDY